MAKRLEDLTLKELWELFPIILAPYDPQWRSQAQEEIGLLSDFLAAYAPKLNHIGSTAIPGIMAKPIIDILVEVSEDHDWDAICSLLTGNGYICMARSAARMSFNKGYTPRGYARRVFHIHIRRPGDNDEILFRDYLTAHADAAKEYEALKLSLLPKFRNDRDAYTAAKSPFVSRILAQAKKLFF